MAEASLTECEPQSNGSNKTAPLWAVFVVVLYFFSGVAALSYEVLWARLLSLQFGVSIFGVVITVAAFMAGLGAGSLLGAKISPHRSPLLILALIEFAVACFAFAMPSIFAFIENTISSSSASIGVEAWFGLQFVFALIVLFIPAAALGVGFPLVLRALRNQSITLGSVYGVNALGGVVGSLLPLLLLPLLGLEVSLYVVACLGLLLAAAFYVLSRYEQLASSLSSQSVSPPAAASDLSITVLWMYSLVGAGSLILQISWTRLYGMLLLRTEYVMAVILAVFLLGMALGSFFLRTQRSTIWLTALPILSAFGVIAGLWALPLLAKLAASGHYESLWSALWWQGLYVAIFTLPVTFALGAWLPVLANNFKSHGIIVGAKFYGVNAVGCALGTLLAGFVLLPLLGSAAVICLGALILLIAGLYFSPVRAKAMYCVVPLVLLALPVLVLPPVSVLLPNTLADSRDIYQYEDAVSITHVVERADGQRLLLGDLQRMDASSEPTAVVSQQNQARLPLLLHQNPKSILFLGVGTGISVSGSMAYSDLRRVGVEISQGAIEAASTQFSEVNMGVASKQKISLIRDDARRYLKTTSAHYDVIVGDLFHPDLVGRSALLSVEQFQRAKNKLTPDGLFVQWLALNQFDTESLRIVLRTFSYVFDDAHMYLDGFKLAMVGYAGGDARDARNLLANLGSLEADGVGFATGGEGEWTWLGRYFGRIEVGKGMVQAELTPVIEYRLPRARYDGNLDLNKTLQFLLGSRPEVDQAAKTLGVVDDNRESFDRAYMAVELGVRSWMASVSGQQSEAERLIRFAYSANPKDRWIGFDLADRMYSTLDQAVAAGYLRTSALSKILEIRPDHEQALQEMLRVAQRSGDSGRILEYSAKLKLLSPLARPGGVVE